MSTQPLSIYADARPAFYYIYAVVRLFDAVGNEKVELLGCVEEADRRNWMLIQYFNETH